MRLELRDSHDRISVAAPQRLNRRQQTSERFQVAAEDQQHTADPAGPLPV
jgi:hypothetical protein